MPQLKVSVRDLAAFCHRSGDIDYRFRPSPTGVQGTEGHQRVYRKRPASYRSEFTVQYRVSSQFLLRGRADGYDPEARFVEEIKTCRVHPDAIPAPVTSLHMAQARLYGAMIAIQEDLETLEVRLTWFHIDEEREYTLEQTYSRSELVLFLEQSLQRFSNWLTAISRLRENRDASLAALNFPHREFREGQRDIAELVYKCIDQSGQLLVEAPTGIGKTAAVLFPALKALATGKHERIAYLTAKSVGRRTAEETLVLFAEAGYRGSALSMTAKEKICLSPGKACHGDDCPYARGYYDKLPDAMLAAIEVPLLRRQELEDLAQRFEVCPYQLGLDLQPWIDVIIGDLHHMYGLSGLLASQLEAGEQRWTVLLDEAHNLPSRARDMFSAGLNKKDLMSARGQADQAARSFLNRINRAMLGLQKASWQEQDFDSRDLLPETLVDALKHFVTDCGEQQAQDATFLHRQPLVLDFYFGVLQFLRVCECWGEDYRFELSKGTGKQSLELRLNCLDPARLLAARQESLHSLTAFSATLSPAVWMLGALGLKGDAVYRRQASPFSPTQMQIAVVTHIDTRYRARQQSMTQLAQALRQWLRDVPGNCIIYLPSYQYLNDCADKVREGGDLEGLRSFWLQDRKHSDSERGQLLEKLEAERDVAAFCILGGIFGEGIDLPGERLSSVVVVGVGLPQVNRDTRVLREYFQDKYGQGFEYAYLYPGMQKVDQALGRVIRTLDDTGRAMIIDPRYGETQYRELLPPWWAYETG